MQFWKAALLALLAAAPARADDGQIWATLLAQGPVKGDTLLWLEVQPRFTNDASRLGQLVLRPAVGWRLGRDVSAHIGYHYQRNDPEGGPVATEHRAWQQVMFPLLRVEDRLLLGRIRMEERKFVGQGDIGLRLRTQARLQIPLGGKGTAGPLLWTEGFWSLNNTDWGQRTGLGQVRAFAGVLVPLNRHLNLEAGYMNQTILRAGADQSNHVANIALVYRLGE